jgi:hypothetical protein
MKVTSNVFVYDLLDMIQRGGSGRHQSGHIVVAKNGPRPVDPVYCTLIAVVAWTRAIFVVKERWTVERC